MHAALVTTGWVVVGVLGGSSLAFAAVYGWDELQWRRVERRAGRRWW